jgi:hypothetical protein
MRLFRRRAKLTGHLDRLDHILPIVCDDTAGVPGAGERLCGWEPSGA